jgi:hypothetical protein
MEEQLINDRNTGEGNAIAKKRPETKQQETTRNDKKRQETTRNDKKQQETVRNNMQRD